MGAACSKPDDVASHHSSEQEEPLVDEPLAVAVTSPAPAGITAFKDVPAASDNAQAGVQLSEASFVDQLALKTSPSGSAVLIIGLQGSIIKTDVTGNADVTFCLRGRLNEFPIPQSEAGDVLSTNKVEGQASIEVELPGKGIICYVSGEAVLKFSAAAEGIFFCFSWDPATASPAE